MIILAKNSFKICNVIIIVLMIICFVCILMEALFNLLGLWIWWNLFGYLIGLVVLPVCIILQTMSLLVLIIILVADKKNGFVLGKKRFIIFPFVFWSATIVATIFAYAKVFTWGF